MTTTRTTGIIVLQFESEDDYIKVLFALSPTLGLRLRQLGDWKLYLPADAWEKAKTERPELAEISYRDTTPF